MKIDGISFHVENCLKMGKEQFIRDMVQAHWQGLPVKDRALKAAAAFDSIATKFADDNKPVKAASEVVDTELEAAVKNAMGAKQNATATT